MDSNGYIGLKISLTMKGDTRSNFEGTVIDVDNENQCLKMSDVKQFGVSTGVPVMSFRCVISLQVCSKSQQMATNFTNCF